MREAAGVDYVCQARHLLGAAHRDHRIGAVILAGRLFQRRREGRARSRCDAGRG
jgi:hypothetical protein